MAVASQANASFVVPGSANSSDEPVGRRERGRDGHPGEQHQRAHDGQVDGATSGGTSATASEREREREAHARRRAAGRVPIQTPPISEPSAKHASAKPPCAREPCASPNAGIVTSTTPNADAERNDVSMHRAHGRRPERAGTRRRPRRSSAARTGGVSANQIVPIPANAAAATSAAHGGATEAIAATISGPKMKKSSCSQASSA